MRGVDFVCFLKEFFCIFVTPEFTGYTCTQVIAVVGSGIVCTPLVR